MLSSPTLQESLGARPPKEHILVRLEQVFCLEATKDLCVLDLTHFSPPP